MEITAPGKVLGLLLVIVGSFTYIILAMFVDSAPDTTPAWTALSGALFYLLGNGSGAKKGVPTIAPFTPTIDKAIEHLNDVKHLNEEKEKHGGHKDAHGA